ncbi:MAG: hypothetical protein AABY28_04055 [Candidatus Omnitrophota bacterium]
MGIIHKLRPEIENFIIEQKKEDPAISCRGLVLLVQKKFQVSVSKSSINSIFKKAGLSMPVGRRPKKKRRKLEICLQPEVIKSLTAIEAKAALPTEIKVEKPPMQEPEAAAATIEQKPAPAPIEETMEVKAELPSERECIGAILLKAMDYLIGGSAYFTDRIKNRLNRQEEDLLERTESLIYLELLGLDKEKISQNFGYLSSLIGRNLTIESVYSYLNELQSDRMMAPELQRTIINALQEVRLLQLNLSGSNILYFDGQVHTVWSTPHIPYDFSSTICNINGYINRYFYKNEPLVLFMAPGYDIPTGEFFNLMLRLNSSEKGVYRLSICGDKLEELKSFSIQHSERRTLIFGLWPWQFVEYRKVKKLRDFRPFIFEELKKEFYIAEIEIELLQPNIGQMVTLKGAALKNTLSEKTRLVILSNLTSQVVKIDDLVRMYLNHWPNLEEAFQDYSRKIELFTYTGTSKRYLATEEFNLVGEPASNISAFFSGYLKVLDLYFRRYFLPPGYENMGFPTIKERFYGLKAALKQENKLTTVTFQPPQGFPFQKDLEYALRRLNEREVIYAGESRLWFRI